jgi:hypothetical protein
MVTSTRLLPDETMMLSLIGELSTILWRGWVNPLGVREAAMSAAFSF